MLATHFGFPTFFFFNDTATTEIYTLSLHDALPISLFGATFFGITGLHLLHVICGVIVIAVDRKSTRLNSSHDQISYAVFCLKKKSLMVITYPHLTGHVQPH